MKNKKLLIISLVVGTALVLMNYRKFGISEVFLSFKGFNLALLPVYVLVVLGIEFFGTLRWKMVINAFKYRVPFINLFFYRTAGYAIGYLSPQAHIGGEPVRALLLKRHNLSFKQGISTILIDKSMLLVSDIIFIMTAAVMMFLHYTISDNIKLIFSIFIAAMIFFAGSYFYCMFKSKRFFSAIFYLKFWRNNKKIKKIREEIEEVEAHIQVFYKKHFRYFIVVMVFQVFMYLLMFLEYWIALSMFNFIPNPFAVFMIMGAVAISYSMPVPMALGVLETSQVSALGLLNMDKAVGLSISLLVRAKDLVRTLIGVLALVFFGVIGNIFKKKIKQDEKKAVQFI